MTDAGPEFGPLRPCRLAVQQLAMPKYRVEIFNALARRPNVDLRVGYGDAGTVDNDADDCHFAHELHPLRRARVPLTRAHGGRRLLWHYPQFGWASKRTCDVLILTWDLHFASLVPALLRARAAGVRTVLWGHGFSLSEAGWRAKPRRAVTRLADAVAFYNHAIRDRYVANGTPADKCFVALNALDQRPIAAAQEQWPADRLGAWRRAKGLHGRPVVLHVSRLLRDNRADLLLRAVAELRRGPLPDLACVIVGKGEYEADLRKLAQSLGIDDAVHMPGPIYGEVDLAPYFLSADAYAYPRSIGLAVLHAFGYGVPVVTSDDMSTQMPEIEALRDGENGLLYRDGDASDLAGKLRVLIEDKPMRDRLSAEARATVRDRFTIENMADGFVRAVRYCQSLNSK